jgi:hypothetical protein
VDVMAARVARWCEEHFGPLPKDVVATVNEAAQLLAKLGERVNRYSHGKPPKKPGRKNTTKDIADFAEARHRQMTWKDISEEWNRKHPNQRVTHHKVRDAWRRRYGDKAIPSSKLRGEG